MIKNKTKRIGILQIIKAMVGFKITVPGLVVIVGACLCAMLCSYIPVFRILSTMTSLLIISFVISIFYFPRLKISGNSPSRIIAGKTATVRLDIKNESRFTAYDVSAGFFGLPPELKEVDNERIIPHLSTGEVARFDIYLNAVRRGLYPIPKPRAFTSFPFNLFRSGPASYSYESILVLPDYPTMDNFELPVQKRYQPGGVALASSVGDSPEYIGNRQYKPGDSPRKLDSHAWARLGAPAVKEYQEEYYCHVALVMDTYFKRKQNIPAAGIPELEAVISLTASVADAMVRGEDIIDVFAAGPDLYVLRSGRRTGQFENLLEILAQIEHCTKNPFEIVTPALSEELHSTSAVVFILTDWDIHRENMVRMAIEAGCTTKVLIVRDKKTTLSTEQAQQWLSDLSFIRPQDVNSGEYKLQRSPVQRPGAPDQYANGPGPMTC